MKNGDFMGKRFEIVLKEKGRYNNGISIEDKLIGITHQMLDCGSAKDVCDLLNELNDENKQLKHDASVLICSNQKYRRENEELKQYKQSVKDVLLSWSQKNLSAKQLQVIIAIMEQLGIDFE